MDQYQNALRNIMSNGLDRPNRTGTDTRSLFGVMMEFDLTKGFPAVTTKKLAFNQVKGELLGFIRGYDNVKDFQALGCSVWNMNAVAPYWISNASNKGDGDLGRIYGVQWRRWKTHKALLGEPTTEGGMYPVTGYGHCDQLSKVIERIKTDPYDRRLIVSAWNAGEIANHEMALPPCHVLFQFYPDPERRELSMSMYQRSCDMFLGVPFNIASYSLLLSLVAAETGYRAKRFVHFLGDAHVYHDHFDQVREQLARSTLPLPYLRLRLKPSLEEYEPEDIELLGYTHHEPLKGNMAV